MTSYRDSHLHKGEEYHANFSYHPRRSLIWKIEKRVIVALVDKYFAGRPIYHLDFACGTGRIITLLKFKTMFTKGIDVSDSMLAVARKENPEIEFITGDITLEDSLLIADKFNLITAFRFFPNAEPELRVAVLRKLRLHLHDDGVLIFNNHKNYDWIRHKLVRTITLGAKGKIGWREREVRETARLCGFEILEEVHIGFLPEWDDFCWVKPRRLAFWIERNLAGKQGFLRGENVIYVCRPSYISR